MGPCSITGTAKQHVAFDYAARLAEGIAAAEAAHGKAVAALAGLPSAAALSYCSGLNVSRCPATEALKGTPGAAPFANPSL